MVSILLSAVIGGTFFLLTVAIDALRDSENRANHALEALVAAYRLERVVIDIETGQRGFIITGETRFLQPWYRARAGFEPTADTLEHLASMGDAGQGIRAREITNAVDSYIKGYADPLVAAAQHDLRSVRTLAVTADGKNRVDALRGRFEQFMGHETKIFQAGHHRADTTAQQALTAASISVAGSIVLILLSGAYLARSVVRPVRQASEMAGRVAGGDLAVRMPETGPGEIGVLGRAFNKMTGALATNRDELRQIADEQTALRRVATLVARKVSPAEVFSTVAAETGRVLGAECTVVARFEADGTATVTGSWDKPGTSRLAPPLGSRLPAGETSVAGRVQRTGLPVWASGCEAAGGMAAASGKQHAIRSSVDSPIIVEGQLWGVITALSGIAGPQSEGTEERLYAFTELVAMAVANSESRAQLAASRARVVATADETRRRIERDLHDGAQQRLISLALELRSAEAGIPPEQKALARQLSQTTRGLNDAVEELREISRGLHPAMLEKGGLEPALRALGRRAGVPAEINVAVRGRLPERVEVTAYYVVSEAVANAAKHARASVVKIDVGVADQTLRLLVRDDGVGGADPARGSGLIGLSDRVEAVGGRMEIASPPGEGTSLLVTIALWPT